MCRALLLVAALRVLVAPGLVRADEPNLRLRIEWGGGAERIWRGSVSVNEGTLSQLQPLGLFADELRTLVAAGSTVRIQSRRPQQYAGFDVLVHASLDAKVRIELGAPGITAPAAPTEISLADLISGTTNVSLDGENNRLLVGRAPGDALRVEIDRDSMVFAPGEQLVLNCVPHKTGFVPHSSVRLDVQLFTGRTDKELWNDDRELKSDAQGDIEPVDGFEISLPEAEGVYDVVLTLSRQRLRNPFTPGRPQVQRRVQVVVLDDRARSLDSKENEWSEVAAFDPAQPRWWERMPRLPQWRHLPGVRPGPLGNDKSAVRQHGAKAFTELSPGGWHAYPLPTAKVGQPHVLEVEFPPDIPQTLGVSIVEPDAAGAVVPVGLDSGFDVKEDLESKPSLGRHRLVFWPRTKTPYVLLTNRRQDAAAVYGNLRVLAGPRRLPAVLPGRLPRHGRLAAAHFDRPLFPEFFCASGDLDAGSGRSLDDWITFYEGGLRLTEYLRHVGYGGASIAVYCEGSAIYPSRLVDPTPKYDTGPYFSNGQDPLRKDVVELLFRMFDREGLRLAPILQFKTPLPALERALQDSATESVGIELVDEQGRGWVQRRGTQRGMAPYYNPLDDRVRQAMGDVVREIAQRYGHHESFAGIVLDLSPTGYTQLPGAGWGLDGHTIGRFLRDTGLSLPEQGAGPADERAALVLRHHHQRWLDWRAAKIAELYHQFASEVSGQRPEATLFLAAADLIDAGPVYRAMRPALPRRRSIDDAMRELGIDPKLLQSHSSIVFLRPQRLVPEGSLADQSVRLEFNRTSEVDRFFGSSTSTGSLHYHETQPLLLPSFDEASPFGKDKTYTWLAPQFLPAGVVNRKRFIRSLATLDAQWVFDGGWAVAFGQEEPVRDLLEAYRRLPPNAFGSADIASSHSQPAIVRTLSHNGRTYVYLLNDSPWPITANVELNAPADCRVQPLSMKQPPPLSRGPQGTHWVVPLQPYDLVGAILTSPDVAVVSTSVTMSGKVAEELRARITDVRARAAGLKDPRAIKVLTNPGFEARSRGAKGFSGWTVVDESQGKVLIDDEKRYGGTHSLRLQSTGAVAQIRSESFPTPQTGQLSIRGWLRSDRGEKAPALRLIVEGQLNGRRYFRWVAVKPRLEETAESTTAKTESRWSPFEERLDDLPVRGLTGLRVGFDFMGPGTVWIDDLQLYDLWFLPDEQRELNKIIGLADFQLRSQQYADCLHSLNGFWPLFLRDHVPVEAHYMANIPPPPLPATAPASSPADKPKSSVIDRMKRFVPRWPRF